MNIISVTKTGGHEKVPHFGGRQSWRSWSRRKRSLLNCRAMSKLTLMPPSTRGLLSGDRVGRRLRRLVCGTSRESDGHRLRQCNRRGGDCRFPLHVRGLLAVSRSVVALASSGSVVAISGSVVAISISRSVVFASGSVAVRACFVLVCVCPINSGCSAVPATCVHATL